MSLSYEEQRIQNIKDNEALLLSLGLGAPIIPKAPKKLSISKKKNDKNDDDTFKLETTPRPARIQKPIIREIKSNTPDSVNGLRRSGRSSVGGSTPNYKGNSSLWREDAIIRSKSLKRSKREVDSEEEESEDDSRQRKAQKLGFRTADPKTFGHISGVEVGKCWASRMDCSTDAIHAPTVAGISGNPIDGAWSVALSGGYPDDVDLGYAFTYTGSGGRDLKGTRQNPKNLRTAEQSYDQSFDNRFNAALKKSSETHKPVRVIRGFKLPSIYAPVEGYRYDGLYTVEKAWMAKGLTKGLKVCRFAFKRVEGQPPLLLRSDEDEEEAEVKAEEEVKVEKADVDAESVVGEAKVEEEEDQKHKEDNHAILEQDKNEESDNGEDADGNIKQSANFTLKKAVRTLRKVIEVVIPSRSASADKENLLNVDLSANNAQPSDSRRSSLRRAAVNG
ncbi:uncharacterized protein I206_106510 [Kwoniella pini CBS 10737]|uniref:YDG domain-containing protein n=1 Tax=Kwoniella pini CBS 10737 TaxID=1296096 RepID=A0AAJ8MSY9_9TREE